MANVYSSGLAGLRQTEGGVGTVMRQVLPDTSLPLRGSRDATLTSPPNASSSVSSSPATSPSPLSISSLPECPILSPAHHVKNSKPEADSRLEPKKTKKNKVLCSHLTSHHPPSSILLQDIELEFPDRGRYDNKLKRTYSCQVRGKKKSQLWLEDNVKFGLPIDLL